MAGGFLALRHWRRYVSMTISTEHQTGWGYASAFNCFHSGPDHDHTLHRYHSGHLNLASTHRRDTSYAVLDHILYDFLSVRAL